MLETGIFKVDNKKTKVSCKVTINTLNFYDPSVYIGNFEHIFAPFSSGFIVKFEYVFVWWESVWPYN